MYQEIALARAAKSLLADAEELKPKGVRRCAVLLGTDQTVRPRDSYFRSGRWTVSSSRTLMKTWAAPVPSSLLSDEVTM
jgi:hypothetical protein